MDEATKYNNKMGEVIRALRKIAGLSQERLAGKVGVSYQQIQKYEKGTSTAHVPRLKQIAEALGRTHLDLLLMVQEDVQVPVPPKYFFLGMQAVSRNGLTSDILLGKARDLLGSIEDLDIRDLKVTQVGG